MSEGAAMTKHAKINQDGAIELPKDVLDTIGWQPGTDLEVEALPSGLTFRMSKAHDPEERISWDEFRRRVPKHEGLPVSLEEMEQGIDEAMAERWARKERNSR